MTLSNGAKVIVGVLTVCVALFPLAFIFIWMISFFPFIAAPSASDFPFDVFDAVSAFMFPAMCLISLMSYGLMAFYVAHAVKNTQVSDAIRVVAILLVFLFPYLGMPAYYILFILLGTPPSWALKVSPPAATGEASLPAA